MVSIATGVKMWVCVMLAYFCILESADESAADPYFKAVWSRCDSANVCHCDIPSQALSLPPRDKSDTVRSLAIVSEQADWLFRCRYLGMYHTSPDDIIQALCLEKRSALLQHDRLCVPRHSTVLPQGQSSISQSLVPSLRPVATLIVSFDMWCATSMISGAKSQSLACGAQMALSLALSRRLLAPSSSSLMVFFMMTLSHSFCLLRSSSIVRVIIIIIILFLFFIFCACKHEACRLKN